MSNAKAFKMEGFRKRCGVCHYKIRGSNHKEGRHHKVAEEAELRKRKEIK